MIQSGPAREGLTLWDLAGQAHERVEIRCETCGRGQSHNLHCLVETYGKNCKLVDVISELNSRCLESNIRCGRK